MAKSKTNPKLDTPAAIEIMAEYRRELWHLGNASKELADVTGLDEEIAGLLLKDMKRHNVTQIRGYSKEPERLRKGKIGTPYEPKK